MSRRAPHAIYIVFHNRSTTARWRALLWTHAASRASAPYFILQVLRFCGGMSALDEMRPVRIVHHHPALVPLRRKWFEGPLHSIRLRMPRAVVVAQGTDQILTTITPAQRLERRRRPHVKGHCGSTQRPASKQAAPTQTPLHIGAARKWRPSQTRCGHTRVQSCDGSSLVRRQCKGQ